MTVQILLAATKRTVDHAGLRKCAVDIFPGSTAISAGTWSIAPVPVAILLAIHFDGRARLALSRQVVLRTAGDARSGLIWSAGISAFDSCVCNREQLRFFQERRDSQTGETRSRSLSHSAEKGNGGVFRTFELRKILSGERPYKAAEGCAGPSAGVQPECSRIDFDEVGVSGLCSA